MNIIEMENVSFSYPNTPVLQNVNLHIKPGQFIGIIGPNGGGKTTLLKLLLDLIKPTTGTIKLFNQSPSTVLNKIGYVPQRHDLDPTFPINTLEVVLLGALSTLSWYGTYPKDIIKKATELLIAVGLEKKIKAPFGDLSGGETQRALIARALLMDPEILLLDEPTSCIDWHGEKKIFDLLLALKGKKTLLMVSHDLELIVNQVDKVLSVHHIIEICPPEKVCEHFARGLYHEPYIPKVLEK